MEAVLRETVARPFLFPRRRTSVAAYNKFQNFVEDLGKGVHQLHAAGHTLKIYLSNAAPSATNTVKADIAEISAGNGYTAGGADTQNDYTESGGTGTCSAVDVVWTASGGTIGAFRYVILYNDTPTSPADPLIAWWDYGSSITLAAGETFTVDFASNTLFTIG
jgi:hypothetical protein